MPTSIPNRIVYRFCAVASFLVLTLVADRSAIAAIYQFGPDVRWTAGWSMEIGVFEIDQLGNGLNVEDLDYRFEFSSPAGPISFLADNSRLEVFDPYMEGAGIDAMASEMIFHAPVNSDEMPYHLQYHGTGQNHDWMDILIFPHDSPRANFITVQSNSEKAFTLPFSDSQATVELGNGSLHLQRVDRPTAVPEPTSLLVPSGFGLLAVRRKRRRLFTGCNQFG